MCMCNFGQDKSDELSRKIEDSIRKERMKADKEVRLLLLGTAESGKSTLIKQMKCIHEGGFSASERRSFATSIYSNIVDSILLIYDHLDSNLNVLTKEFVELSELSQDKLMDNPDHYLEILKRYLKLEPVKNILEAPPKELNLLDAAN